MIICFYLILCWSVKICLHVKSDHGTKEVGGRCAVLKKEWHDQLIDFNLTFTTRNLESFKPQYRLLWHKCNRFISDEFMTWQFSLDLLECFQFLLKIERTWKDLIVVNSILQLFESCRISKLDWSHDYKYSTHMQVITKIHVNESRCQLHYITPVRLVGT